MTPCLKERITITEVIAKSYFPAAEKIEKNMTNNFCDYHDLISTKIMGES